MESKKVAHNNIRGEVVGRSSLPFPSPLLAFLFPLPLRYASGGMQHAQLRNLPPRDVLAGLPNIILNTHFHFTQLRHGPHGATIVLLRRAGLKIFVPSFRTLAHGQSPDPNHQSHFSKGKMTTKTAMKQLPGNVRRNAGTEERCARWKEGLGERWRVFFSL